MEKKSNGFNIFDVKINTLNSSDLFDFLINLLKSNDKVFISKINTEFLLRAFSNAEFRDTINASAYSLTDGRGVLWAAKYVSIPISGNKFIRPIQAVWQMIYSGASLIFYPKFCTYPIPENIPGVDAMYLMLEAAIEADASVYFFGAEKSVLENAVDKIQGRYSKLQIAGYHDGWDYKDKEIIDEINKSGAKLLIVALGSPKQEYWIRDNMDKLSTVRVAVGEGGSLDFVAGSFKRAPKWMQGLGLEWLWRLFMNKSKTQTGSRFKRVWNAVPVFIYQVVKYKIKNGATKIEN